MSRQITQKIIQSLVWIQTRTRSLRLCGGTRLRRLTQTLQPSSQCPTGADRSHRSADVVPTSNWCEYSRDSRQAVDRACFSFLSGSNPLSTSYARMPMQNRAGTRPWGLTIWGKVRSWRMCWSRHSYQISCTVREKPPVHDRSYHCGGCVYLTCKQSSCPHTEAS